MRKLTFTLSAGVLATLISEWLIGSFFPLHPALRWPVSVGLGLVAALSVLFRRRPKSTVHRDGSSRSQTEVASALEGRNVRVEDVNVEVDEGGPLKVASDISAERDAAIKGVRVHRGRPGAKR